MLAEHNAIDISQLTSRVEGPKVYEQLVQAPLAEVLAMFEVEHQAEAQALLESCFNITILQAIEGLPPHIQTEFMSRLQPGGVQVDSLSPVEWLMATVKETHPTFGEELKRALIQTKNEIVAMLGVPEPTL